MIKITKLNISQIGKNDEAIKKVMKLYNSKSMKAQLQVSDNLLVDTNKIDKEYPKDLEQEENDSSLSDDSLPSETDEEFVASEVRAPEPHENNLKML